MTDSKRKRPADWPYTDNDAWAYVITQGKGIMLSYGITRDMVFNDVPQVKADAGTVYTLAPASDYPETGQ